MIEKVHEQAEKRLVRRDAAHVVVVQAVVEVAVAQAVGPGEDQLVQPDASGLQGVQFSEGQLIEVARRVDGVQRRQHGIGGGMQGKALEPDRIAQDQVVQRAEDRAEKCLPVLHQRCRAQLAGRVIDLAVHPLIVVRHQCDLFDTVHVCGLLLA